MAVWCVVVCVVVCTEAFPAGYDRVYNDYPPKDVAHKDPYVNYFSKPHKYTSPHQLLGFPYTYQGFPFNYYGFPFRGGYHTAPAAHVPASSSFSGEFYKEP